MNELEHYLIKKKIDPIKFKRDEGPLYLIFENTYLEIHPKSFTAQKLFLLNKIRRKYLLTDDLNFEKNQ